MGKNKGQETVQMYRWDQYNERWIPFTGSVDTQGKVKIVADSLPIPAGAATSANQTNGSQKTQIVDAGGEQATVSGGRLDVNVPGLITVNWDYLSKTEGATSNTFVFKTGGAGGTTVATLVVDYTDSTKATLLSVTKS